MKDEDEELDQNCGFKAGTIVRTTVFVLLHTQDGNLRDTAQGTIMTFVDTIPSSAAARMPGIFRFDEEWLMAFIVDGSLMVETGPQSSVGWDR